MIQWITDTYIICKSNCAINSSNCCRAQDLLTTSRSGTHIRTISLCFSVQRRPSIKSANPLTHSSLITSTFMVAFVLRNYLQEVIDGPFNASAVSDLYATYADLIEPYATSERTGYTFLSSPASFRSAVDALKNHVVSRNAAVRSY